MNRREVLATTAAAGALLATQGARALATDRSQANGVKWISTSPQAVWRSLESPVDIRRPTSLDVDIITLPGKGQVMTGFGGAFSELGWDALQALSTADRNAVLAALFSSDGAAFNLCRTPLGASDFARGWYSYDEVEGDFELTRFSIKNDRQTLIPFIKAALAVRPDLKLWASPWSPPTWMKKNKFYAMAAPRPGQAANGIKPEQVGSEGVDTFIQDDRYFASYARYFRRYVEAYRAEGIPISMVMPQNEFNSLQTFPSCNWTSAGLARFLPFLGKEMGDAGVEIFLGTFERPDPDMISKIISDPQAGPVVKGIGLQWGGKEAFAELRRRYPAMAFWGTEQECGNGRNDWLFARYAWSLMRTYIENGASAYQYWNLALASDQKSTWGWKQNSLVTINTQSRTYTLNPEYYVMRHLSQFVRPGATYVTGFGFAGHDSQMIFRNPDGSVVVLIANILATAQVVRIMLGSVVVTAELPADSFNTLVLPAQVLTSPKG